MAHVLLGEFSPERLARVDPSLKKWCVEERPQEDPDPCGRHARVYLRNCGSCGSAEMSGPHWCGFCAGTRRGTPGIPEPRLGEEWESNKGERVRVVLEYREGPFGGLATGMTADGRELGMRRGNVEKGRWRLFKGPSSTIDEVLLCG